MYLRATIILLVSSPVVVFKIEFVFSESQVGIFMPMAKNQQGPLGSELICGELSPTLIGGPCQELRQTGARIFAGGYDIEGNSALKHMCMGTLSTSNPFSVCVMTLCQSVVLIYFLTYN